jgi:hypothetical protein
MRRCTFIGCKCLLSRRNRQSFISSGSAEFDFNLTGSMKEIEDGGGRRIEEGLFLLPWPLKSTVNDINLKKLQI